VNRLALFIALLAFVGACAGFFRAQFTGGPSSRALAGSIGLMVCGLVAITVALSA
jgi:hypothetical protein